MNNNLLHQRLLDKESKPDKEIIQKTIGKTAKTAWSSLQRFINTNYDLTPETVFYGSNYGWALRYRKSGKTLCCFFPEEGAFSVLIVLGKKEIEKAMNILSEFSNSTKEIILNTPQLHDGRWLWIRIFRVDEIDDIKNLIKIKQKPIKIQENGKFKGRGIKY
ncbi:MAG: DUF3788 domain-containing protein [Candidatus Humimicrobiaceae bacterium]